MISTEQTVFIENRMIQQLGGEGHFAEFCTIIPKRFQNTRGRDSLTSTVVL